MVRAGLIPLLMFVVSWSAHGQDLGRAAGELSPGLILDFPLFDLPYNATDGSFVLPSMRQSMAISSNFYQGVHYWIADDQPTLGQKLGIIAFDTLTLQMPLSNSWMHEEWHRAVLGKHGMGSYNDIYKFPIGRDVISVSHVLDSDLIALKRDHPADQVRLSSAGIESQYEQNLYLEKRRFFFETQSWDKATLLYNVANNIFYLGECASGASDTETDRFNNDEGADVPRRDFTGLDCNGWVYDLFRPDEPYVARGAHPSGVGINRYRKWSDLTGDEQRFLRTQFHLSFLNLLDPFLVGVDWFEAPIFGWGEKWNATLRHHITSFGYSIEGNFFVKAGGQNWLFIIHNFVNAVRYFPGLTAELERWQIPDSKWRLTSRLSGWLQPEDQRLKSTVSMPGALLAATLHYPFSRRIELSGGVEAKTAGWVAGNAYLEPNLSVFGGTTFLF